MPLTLIVKFWLFKLANVLVVLTDSDVVNWMVMTSPALAKFECRFDEVVVTDPATTDAGIVSVS